MKRPDNKLNRFTVGTGLTPEERRRLRELAQKEARSLSAQITVMLRQQLAQLEQTA
jgi:hypothetical protein